MSVTSPLWTLKIKWCSLPRPNWQVNRKRKLDITPQKDIDFTWKQTPQPVIMWKEASPTSLYLNVQAVQFMVISLSNIIWFFNHKKLKGVTKKRTKFRTKWGYTELCRVIQMLSENAMTFFLISNLGQNWKEQGQDWWGLAKTSWFFKVS